MSKHFSRDGVDIYILAYSSSFWWIQKNVVDLFSPGSQANVF